MTTWEYFVAPLLEHNPGEILNTFGDDGWELVTVAQPAARRSARPAAAAIAAATASTRTVSPPPPDDAAGGGEGDGTGIGDIGAASPRMRQIESDVATYRSPSGPAATSVIPPSKRATTSSTAPPGRGGRPIRWSRPVA
jgi:hypothetical protein